MPSKSRAQMRLMFAKAARGEISQATAEHFKPTKAQYKKLPERVKPKGKTSMPKTRKKKKKSRKKATMGGY